jgi:hypothetical protein
MSKPGLSGEAIEDENKGTWQVSHGRWRGLHTILHNAGVAKAVYI